MRFFISLINSILLIGLHLIIRCYKCYKIWFLLLTGWMRVLWHCLPIHCQLHWLTTPWEIHFWHQEELQLVGLTNKNPRFWPILMNWSLNESEGYIIQNPTPRKMKILLKWVIQKTRWQYFDHFWQNLAACEPPT